MSYYRTCPDCGAHLDAGERCDCLEEQNRNKTGTTNNEKFNRILNQCKNPRRVAHALMALHTKGENDHEQD